MAPVLRQKRTLSSTWSTGRKRVSHTPRIIGGITKRTLPARADRKPSANFREGDAPAVASARRKPPPAVCDIVATRPVTRLSKRLQLLTPRRSPSPSTPSTASSDAESEFESDAEMYMSPPESISGRRSRADPFPFYDLPTELRLMILDHALETSHYVNVSFSHRALSIMHKQSDSMQRTCKIMRIEVLDVLRRRVGTLEHDTLETAARGADFAWLFNMDAWRRSENPLVVYPPLSVKTLVVNWVLPPDVRSKSQGIGAAEASLLANARSALRRFENLYAFAIYTTNFTNSGGRRRSRRARGEAVYCIEFISRDRTAELDMDVPEHEPFVKPDETQIASLDASLLCAFPASAPIVSLGSRRVSWNRLVTASKHVLRWANDELDRDAAHKLAHRASLSPYHPTMSNFIDEELSLGSASREALLDLTLGLTRPDRGSQWRWAVRIFRNTL